MPNFRERSNETELMDDLQCSGEVIEQTLRELEVINKWLGGNNVTINGIEKLTAGRKKLRIADVGCGGGDILKLIARWGRKNNIELDLTGIDANPNIIKFASDNCSSYPEIHFDAIDIFSDTFRQSDYDIITSTLFTHHFSDKELKEMLNQWAQQSNIGVVINDLHRHWFAYYSIKWITQLFSKSPMVKNDAPVSVMRSFLKNDLRNIISKNSFPFVSIKWMWAFRWQLIITKP